MNYYPFHIGDYAVHTRHLSLMEDLAYRRCIDLYYTRECALPADVAQVARLVGMRDHLAEVEAVLREFFTQEEHGDWIHMRCEAEIKKAAEAAERARTNGKAGGRPQKPSGNPVGTQPVISGNPDESKSKAPNPKTNPKTKEEDPPASRVPRATRKCPEQFSVTDEMREWAALKAPGVALTPETEAFMDYTFRSSISDWEGAWRNWMRKAAKTVKPQAAGETAWQRSQRERVAEMTGGLLGNKPPARGDIIDMEPTHGPLTALR